jgi:CubicO group peptidase (beta-lactamase class C family)
MNALLLCALLLQESADIDALLRDKVEADEPGFAVLVMKGGSVIHKKGYGASRLEPKTPVGANTPFELASCSKQLTALGILILRDQGKLKLDDDIRTWLKELKEPEEGRPIRVRDLVHHTSGLQDYLSFIVSPDPAKPLGNEDALKLIADRRLEFETGRQFSYSNTNYCLLALIIERITKKSFGRFMKDELFDPLKMKQAAVLEKGTTIKAAALGYVSAGREFEAVKNPILTTGDGGIYLSLDDWVAFERGLPGLMKKETLREARTPGRFDHGKPNDYAFGLMVQQEKDRTVLAHEGAWAGFRSIYLRWVEEDCSVIILSNRIDLNLAGLGQEIAGKLLK